VILCTGRWFQGDASTALNKEKEAKQRSNPDKYFPHIVREGKFLYTSIQKERIILILSMRGGMVKD
jgi:hypothetical protein